MDQDILDTPSQEDDKKQIEASPDEPKVSEEETIAMARGWKPKEEWDGPENEWKPAKVFNEIGELKEKIASSEKELKKTNKVIQLMKEHHLNVRKSAYQEAVETLRAERQKALKEQDFARAEELRDEIDDVKDKFTNQDVLPKDVEEKVAAVSQEPDPAFVAFTERNPWYKPDGNEMSRKADAIGWAYKQSDPSMPFADIIKKVEKDIRKMYPEKFEAPRQAVNDGGNRGSGESSKGKVKLSDDERAVARSFNMTDEEYAKELSSYKGR